MPTSKTMTFAPLDERANFANTALRPGAALHGFTVESAEPLAEIDGTAIVMRHGASGARLLFLRNEDENKAFSISFKTPPTDDTGVFHILEHSVLCGSDKFPVKEPFVNLLKGSMQTFLNALTFPDKTMYPVASTNDQDLVNLMDVYMDAVLHPAIYAKPEIFQQEGWHYELDGFDAEGAQGEGGEGARGEGGEEGCEGAGRTVEAAALDSELDACAASDGVIGAQAVAAAGGQTGAASHAAFERLRYNGVVFNEMKGALSDPESVLYRAVNAALFPDTCYACESGGDPRVIPTLTYEQFLDTHARHYRLDNSYIVLYGNVDADAVLGFLDNRYLSAPNCASRTVAAPDEIGVQAPRVDCNVVVPMDTVPENACVGAGYVIGDAADFERVLACDVLLDALMGGNESPIKRAILDAGLGGDATAYLVDSQAQPVALFQLKGAHAQCADQGGEGVEDGEGAARAIDPVATRFMQLVESEVRKLVEGGIPRDLLEASLSQMAFDLRERDRGMADGVPLAMNALAGWLYDDSLVTTYLRYEDALAHMRAGLETRYFEEVLESLVLGSNHKALVEVRPQETGAAAAEAAELSAKLATLQPAAKREICNQVAALRTMQETPDSPEGLATLPRLRVADIGPAVPDPQTIMRADTPLPCMLHALPTRHIDYVFAYFDMNHLAWEDMPYVTVLTMLLTRLGTAARTAAELDVHMRSHLGSLRFFADAYVCDSDPSVITLKMTAAASALSEELEHVPAIAREVWETTRFTDAAKIRDILVQRRIAMEQGFANEGHARAMNRVSSYHFEAGVLREAMSGVDFYWFLKDLIDHFDERFDALAARLERLRASIFTGRDAVVSFTGSAHDCDRFWEYAGTWGLDAKGQGEGAEAFAEGIAPGAGGQDAEEAKAAAESPSGRAGTQSAFASAESAPAAGQTFGANASADARWKMGMPAPAVKSEAFIVPSDVSFVAKGANVGAFGPYSGLWAVAGNALSLDYLWNEVRVKGGAYGTGFRMLGQGGARFYSYRDPGIDATLARFDEAAAWVAAFDPDQDEMEGYIVSTVASHDAPVKPRQVARRQDSLHFSGRPADYRERLRAEKLAAAPEAIRALAPVLEAVAREGAVCVFGNEEAIRAAKAPMNPVKLV